MCLPIRLSGCPQQSSPETDIQLQAEATVDVPMLLPFVLGFFPKMARYPLPTDTRSGLGQSDSSLRAFAMGCLYNFPMTPWQPT